MRRVLTLLACLISLGASLPAAAPASRGLQTAVVDTAPMVGPQADLAFAHVRAAGATKVKLLLPWPAVVPNTKNKPLFFNSANPADSHYNWGWFDLEISRAVAHGLDPIVYIDDAPRWAEGSGTGREGSRRPDPVELGKFAQAAALRFSGSFHGLPRVRYWQVWNEPNLQSYLSPQSENGQLVAPDIYRAMVNHFAGAVHAVHPGNRVIAGGLAPFSAHRGSTAPLAFMRGVLCMSGRAHPRPSCGDHASFDIWSTHPYTSGGPSHHAIGPDDVSLGDLPQMKRLLDAAQGAGHIDSRGGKAKFWVTEFGWDTKPPDGNGVPLHLDARWVAEALYRMWHSGVSLVTWFKVRDDANEGQPDPQVFQSGLYFRCVGGLQCDQPKPALRAFRFPFVALRSGLGVYVWGRTPWGQPRPRVLIERRSQHGWTRVARLGTDRHGIFRRHIRTSKHGDLRVRIPGTARRSLPFTLLKKTPDLAVNPFG
jgi:hypothetical protein